MGAHACSVLVEVLLEILLEVEVLLDVLLPHYTLFLCSHCHHKYLDPLHERQVCNPLEYCIQLLLDFL
jgi:hypothetical protein